MNKTEKEFESVKKFEIKIKLPFDIFRKGKLRKLLKRKK